VANNVWDASTDNDGNVAANWSLGWVPKAGDVMVFDSATTNDNCTFSGAVTCDGLAFANTYTGTINFNGHAMGFGTSDFLGANGGSATVNCAASTITCSGNFDNKDIGTWTRGTSTLVLSGSGTFTGSQNLYNVTVSGTYTILLGSEIDAYGTTLTISGALTCNGKLYSRSGNTLTISGTLSGTGNAILQGHTFAEMSGTYSIDDTSMYVGSDIAFTLTGNATLGGDWVFRYAGALTFGSHEYTFSGAVKFDPIAAGVLTIANGTNSPDLVFEGDVTVGEMTGTVTWTKGTGSITISGASDQDIDFNGKTTEEIIVDKSAGVVSFTGDVDPDYFEANADTAGGYTLDLVGNTITSGGKVDIDGGPNGAAFVVVAPDCLGSYPQNGTYNGEPAYEIAGGAYWIWYNGSNLYFISVAKGTTANAWGIPNPGGPDPEGLYIPSGTSTGWPMVSLAAGTCTVVPWQVGGFVVGNDGIAAGTMDGVSGTQLDLMGLAFDLQNSSTLVANYCDISFSAVSNGTGDATAVTNSDGGDNTNWSFASGATPFAFIDRRKKMLRESIIGR